MTDLLFYLGVAVVMVLAFMMRKRQNLRLARAGDARRSKDAARFGWQVESDQSGLFEILRWRGTTGGVTWIAECLRSGIERPSSRVANTRITRWSVRRPLDAPATIALLHRRDTWRHDLPDAGESGAGEDSLAGELMATALGSAFTVRFGDLAAAIDAQSLVELDAVASRYPEYAVFASNPVAAASYCFQKLDRLLATNGELREIEKQQLSVLVTREGVALSQAEWLATADALQPLVNAGVALTTALGS